MGSGSKNNRHSPTVGELLGHAKNPLESVVREVFGRERPDETAAASAMRLRQFVEEAWHVLEPDTPFIPGWHVDAICEHLEYVAAADIQRLVINIGPGYAKSVIVSVMFPAWMWTHRAGWRSIFSSYDSGLSTRDTVRSRSVITSDWYQKTFSPPWELASDVNLKTWYKNTRMGERMSTSVDGVSTGWRGDAVIVDDPISARDRHNLPRHEAVADWWDKVMSSRLNDQRTGARVIIMQRLHERDLTGHVLAKGGYHHLCLPTEFDPKRRSATVTKSGKQWTDPRTAEGELLFPTLFGPDVVTQIKTDLGSWDFAAQHDQQALPTSGGIFKREWFKFYRRDALPQVCNQQVQSWDLAFKKKEDSDFVVGQVWERYGANYYLRAERRGRMGFADSKKAVRDLSRAWPDATAKLIESKANGPALVEELRNEIPGLIAVENNDGVREHAWARSAGSRAPVMTTV
jgi:hypothetical protein